MTAVEMRADLSTLTDALVSGNTNQLISTARNHLQQGEAPDVLIGRIALLAAQGNADGHVLLTLAACAMLCRLLRSMPDPLNPEIPARERGLPLFVRALLVAAPAVRAGLNTQEVHPEPFFPSGLEEGQTVGGALATALGNNNTTLAERLLLGLYGTGADYRTIEIRTYDALATTFQKEGHPLIYAARSFQILDAVEWGTNVPTILHWLAPHLSLRPDGTQPDWIATVHSFASEPAHSLTSIRTRISTPKDENALPLRQLLQSDANTVQICQAVYDAVIKGNCSPKGVASVIALAAADVVQRVDPNNQEEFVRAAHGLLFSSSVLLGFQQVQDVEALPMLFTSAAFVNVLQKEVAAQPKIQAQTTAPARIHGGGLVATSQLDTLEEQLLGGDYDDALMTAHRYLNIGYDMKPLFATIGLVGARSDSQHALQIIQAASEVYRTWEPSLSTNIEVLLQVTLRAALLGPRNELFAHL